MNERFKKWMMKSNGTAMLGLVGLLSVAAQSAQADGVVDIRPTGSTTFTISAPGSYRLVTDVQMTVTTGPCISITADGVTLDLNGHSLTGMPGTPAGGIVGNTSDRTTIMNGTIREFTSMGVQLATQCILKNLIIEGCDSMGVNIGANARVTDCTVTGNSGSGVVVGANSIVTNCTVRGNGALGSTAGISAGNNTIISHCVISANAASVNSFWGILGGHGMLIEHNTISENDAASDILGILLNGDSCTVRNNVITDNVSSGGSAHGIAGDNHLVASNNNITRSRGAGNVVGILGGIRAQIVNNLISDNDSTGSGTARGIKVSTDALIQGNEVMDNDGVTGVIGIETTSRCSITDNVVSENDTTNAGDATGIAGSSQCVIEGNSIHNNNEGPNSLGISRGIRLSSGGFVRGNNILGNSAAGADGATIGIDASLNVVITANQVTDNDATGAGQAIGILVTGGARIEENHVGSNGAPGSGTSRGIVVVVGTDSLVINNSTFGHDSLMGINITTAGNFHENNRCAEGRTIIPGNTTVTGNQADVDF